MEYRVDVCESTPLSVLRLWWEVRPDRLGADIAAGMRELTATTGRAGLTACGAPTITYADEPAPGGALKIEFEVPVDLGTSLGPRSDAEVVVRPGGLVARTCHRGGYDRLGSAYAAMHEWLRASDYRQVGPPAEVYLIGPDEVSNPNLLVTEIRIPVIPAPVMTERVHAPFADVVRHTLRELAQREFELISEADMRSLLHTVPAGHLGEYLLIIACHPRLTGQAVAADPQAGWLASSTVTVHGIDSAVTIAATDPMTLAQSCVPEVQDRARELRELLTDVLAAVRAGSAA
jgi:effector-binding domain-containing protein